MSLHTKSLGTAALLAGALLAGHSYANETAVDAAMKACVTPGQSTQNKLQCEFGVLAMNKVMTAAKAGEKGRIEYDFASADDMKGTKAAREAMYKDLQTCADQKGKEGGPYMTQCEINAFDKYQSTVEK